MGGGEGDRVEAGVWEEGWLSQVRMRPSASPTVYMCSMMSIQRHWVSKPSQCV